LREGDDLLFPASWAERSELIAYSKEGYKGKVWTLPPDWSAVAAVDIYRITAEGLTELRKGQQVGGGRLDLSLEPGMAVSIFKGE